MSGKCSSVPVSMRKLIAGKKKKKKNCISVIDQHSDNTVKMRKSRRHSG